MKIKRIFTNQDTCKLWAVCYPSDKVGSKWVDIFTKVMRLWGDAKYLMEYFKSHKILLETDFWRNMSIEEAVDKVSDEREHFDNELYSIEKGLPGYEKISMADIFLPLHNNIYSINFTNESFRKAKPDFEKPMIRIYGIELEDGTIIVTGGAIKLTKDMPDDQFDDEFNKLNHLRDYLKSEGIIDKQGLLE